MLLVHHTATDMQRYWYTIRTLTNELFYEMARRKGVRHKKCFQHALFYDFRSESVCGVKTVWAGDHVVWSRISSILLLFISLHGWKMVYFRNLLCTLPLGIGCQFSRLTVRYLSEGGAYQNYFFANYKAVRDIFLFLCLFKNDHKSTKKWNF